MLWVDALCINQADIPERNKQVKRMAQIYRRARKVVAWLGPESSTSDGALATLDFIGAQVVATINGGRSSAPGAVHPLWYRQKTTLPYQDDTWAAISDLLARPWFSRLWVVQEIQLAAAGSSLQCGYSAVPWSNFLSAILCLYSKPQIEYSDSPCAQRLYEQLRKLNRFIWIRAEGTFADLLFLAQGLGCVDPRDKIYGLLGLSSPKLFKAISPDYSTPAAAVYQSLFLTTAAETQRLDCLAWCRLAGANTLGLPSWVPDWSLENRLAQSAGLMFASGYSRASYRLLSNTVLAVDGVRAGRVKEVRGPSPTSTADVLSAIRAWAPEDLLDGTYPTGESALDAFTLVLYQYLLIEHAPNEREGLQETREALRKHVKGAVSDDESRGGPLAYLTSSYLKGRVFLRTEDGRFGFGPSDTQPGDVIATVLGCACLLLLRPMGDRFRVVGLEHAESLLGPVQAPWRLRFSFEFTTNYHTPHFYNLDTEESTVLGHCPGIGRE
ncbi:heterokaryon incompatibility protein-domain-containing protein [Cercophora newfieldiana]|uniref:Heterokaryon incompatibility protein-domain-containing protein n=1 Tax=Cercophora newfieldiana TaxID=92897 RepID=A0AA39XYJ4_9PEZI|nr:heterokaryon incompatibility protein-domain-containing protein [Cercophora newfieldiana]